MISRERSLRQIRKADSPGSPRSGGPRRSVSPGGIGFGGPMLWTAACRASRVLHGVSRSAATALIAATAIALAVVTAPKAGAQGLPFMYTYNTVFCGDLSETVDPVNLVFLSAPSWIDVDRHWGEHLAGWSWSNSSDVKMNTFDSSQACRGMQAERGTGGDLDPQRSHARMMEFGYVVESASYNTGWHVHASAHAESFSFECGKHVTYDYNWTRNDIASQFNLGGHTIIDWQWWGNDEPQWRCNGSEVASDGFAPYISIGHELEGVDGG